MKLNKSQIIFIIFVFLGFVSGIIIRNIRKTTLPSNNYEKIIVIGPNITEILFSLKLESKISAIDNYSLFPPETEMYEKIGGILNPDMEKILLIEPDLIFISGYSENLEYFCNENNIEFMNLPIDNISTILSAIDTISNIFDIADRGDSLISKINKELDIIKYSSPLDTPSVLVAITHSDDLPIRFMTISDKSFLGELILLSGGINVFGDNIIPYPEVSKEAVILSNPDIIIEIQPENIFSNYDSLELVNRWKNTYKDLPAVLNNKIYILHQDFFLIPGPRFIQTAFIFNELFKK